MISFKNYDKIVRICNKINKLSLLKNSSVDFVFLIFNSINGFIEDLKLPNQRLCLN